MVKLFNDVFDCVFIEATTTMCHTCMSYREIEFIDNTIFSRSSNFD